MVAKTQLWIYARFRHVYENYCFLWVISRFGSVLFVENHEFENCVDVDLELRCA